MNTNNREQPQTKKSFTVTPLQDLTATHSVKVGTDTSPAVSLTNSGSVTATGTITGGNVTATGAVTGGNVTATEAMTGGSISTAGAVTGGSVSATGAITGGDITSSGNISTSNGVVTGRRIESTEEVAVAAAGSLRIGQTVLNEETLKSILNFINGNARVAIVPAARNASVLRNLNYAAGDTEKTATFSDEGHNIAVDRTVNNPDAAMQVIFLNN